MRIFLSSTAYDLADARDLCAEALRARGHEPVHHENALFPQYRFVHSHDRCLLAVKDCDALACVVDRRYGGTYAGALRAGRAPVTVPVRKGKILVLQPAEVSVTWMEVLEGRDLGLPVMTFARQKTLDENELRKRNAHLKSIRMVHVADKQYRLFDFLDWTTHQPRDNWIEKFSTITELRDRMIAWVDSLATGSSTPSRASRRGGKSHVVSLVVFVEGRTDAALVRGLANALDLPLRLDVVPIGGKARMLGNIEPLVERYATRYDALLFLADADTQDTAVAAAEMARFRQRVPVQSGVYACLAVPDADAWINATVGEQIGSSRGADVEKLLADNPLTPEQVKLATSRSTSLDYFVRTLVQIGTERAAERSQKDIQRMLIVQAKRAFASARGKTTGELIVTLSLDSELEIHAGIGLEEEGVGHVIMDDGEWKFILSEDDLDRATRKRK